MAVGRVWRGPTRLPPLCRVSAGARSAGDRCGLPAQPHTRAWPPPEVRPHPASQPKEYAHVPGVAMETTLFVDGSALVGSARYEWPQVACRRTSALLTSPEQRGMEAPCEWFGVRRPVRWCRMETAVQKLRYSVLIWFSEACLFQCYD